MQSLGKFGKKILYSIGRALAILVSLLLLLTSCSSPAASKVEDTGMIKVSCTYGFYDMDVDSDGSIYIADRDQIKVIGSDGKEKYSIRDELEFCTNLAVDEENNKLYVIDDSGKQLKLFDLKGKYLAQHDLGSEDRVEKVEIINHNVFLLYVKEVRAENTGYEQTKHILIFNPDTQKTQRIDIDGLDGFSAYKDNLLIITTKMPDDTGMLMLQTFDYTKEKAVFLSGIEDSVFSHIFDSKNNAIYYPFNNKLIRKSMESDETDTVFIAQGATLYKTVFKGNLCFISDPLNNVVYKVDKKRMSPQYTTNLSVLSNVSLDMSVTDCIDYFEQANPGIKVKYEYVEDNDNYNRRINTGLMANDNSLDIFYSTAYRTVELARNNAVLELEEYTAITGKFDNMFDGIRENCSYNGKLFGVPASMSLFAWEVNETLLTKLGLDYPEEGWTWEDFYQYARNACRDIDGDGISDTYALAYAKDLCFNMLRYQYNCNFLDTLNKKAEYNTNQFISLLKVLKKLWDEDLILDGLNFNGYKYNKHKSPQDDNVLFFEKRISLNEGDAVLISPPLVGSKYPVNIECFCINKYSKNIDLAVKFLEKFLSEEVQTSFIKVMNSPLNKDIASYHALDGKPIIDQPYNEFCHVSNDKNYKLYTDTLKKSVLVKGISELDIYINELVSDYLNEKITAEEVAIRIDEKAGMILGE